jgi:hypothetical protein
MLQSHLGSFAADTSPIVHQITRNCFVAFFQAGFFFRGPQTPLAKGPKSLVASLDQKNYWLQSSCAAIYASQLAVARCLS